MKRLIIILCLSFALTGCLGSKQNVPTRSIDGMQLIRHDGDVQVWRNPKAKVSDYTAFVIAPVELRMTKEQMEDSGIDQEDLDTLGLYFHEVLTKALSERFEVTETAGPKTLTIRAAITDVVPSNPVMNSVSSVMPVGIALSFGRKILTGKHSYVGEAAVTVDFLNNRNVPQARFSDRRVGEKYDGGGITTLGHAEDALEDWAEAIGKGFEEIGFTPKQGS